MERIQPLPEVREAPGEHAQRPLSASTCRPRESRVMV
ncbi:hypothetical protein MXAN_3196 [Myxococcus xanthus DK 1622]|uniref:Uncharacterized protein n=1 Tax=Myxococcus xanthus (strain DK1622) TaxID=246197 RepID=Q1D7H6_MYXXD|nr:hypothetical protein MXAN_3196 [Myxococcus xanthus DK 1622]